MAWITDASEYQIGPYNPNTRLVHFSDHLFLQQKIAVFQKKFSQGHMSVQTELQKAKINV